MVYALKVENKRQMNLTQFIQFGLSRFRQAEHTHDYEPATIEVNPQDRAKLPAKFTFNNIPVVASKELEPGFLRVITEDIPGVEA